MYLGTLENGNSEKLHDCKIDDFVTAGERFENESEHFIVFGVRMLLHKIMCVSRIQ